MGLPTWNRLLGLQDSDEIAAIIEDPALVTAVATLAVSSSPTITLALLQ